MLIVCDIDGTVADVRPRSKRAGSVPPRKQRKAFQMWLDRLQSIAHLKADPPIQQVIDTIKLLQKKRGNKLVYLTGRSEKYRKATRWWLRKHGCPQAPLFMRKNDDWRSPRKYKEEIMLDLDKLAKGKIMILDDDGDGDCSKMYQRHGWVHLKVIV